MKKIYKSIYALLVFSLMANFSFATTHTIIVANFTFSPANLSVSVGDTMIWIWANGNHTTTSDNIPATAQDWDAPIESSSTSFEYVVGVEGVYNYHCTFHQSSGMVGSFTASSTTGIKNVGNTSFSFTVCQNTSDKSIMVKLDTQLSEAADITMMDISGQIVYSSSDFFFVKGELKRLDVISLPTGIYLVELRSGKLREVKRIIVQ